ncbi:MAG: exo-beta-N-acetylmuramidase NamZ family protein [Ignavibacteria bacterium]
MNVRIIFLACFLIPFVLASQPKVKLGIDILQDDYKFLVGKRVGLITNATGVDSRLNSTIDIIYSLPGVKLVALFGPEHGVRGDIPAGEKIESYIDTKTGLPVYSLYGKTRKPTKEMLTGIDVLIYDIQDIGVRSYTYISTMGLAMEAAAENNIQFVVLDRPNPLTGEKFEGSIVRDEFISFISQFPIPYIYGLTCGELATMINEEGWLSNRLKCDLKVIKMKGWQRSMRWEDTGLQWVPTSPHIPHYYSAQFYAATGILGELGLISEGVGYTLPFQLLGAEWIDENEIAKRMNSLQLDGVIFRPVVWRPFYGNFQGKILHGVQVHITDFKRCNLTSIQFYFLQELKKIYPDKDIFDLAKPDRIRMFDLATGWDNIRKMFSQNYDYSSIKNFWEKEANEFKSKAQKYFIY